MMSQMRYSGVLECVRVRRSGFDVRRDYSVFVQAFIYFAYPLAAPALLPDECDLTELQVRSLAILTRAEVKPEHFRLGKTKVFLKVSYLAQFNFAIIYGLLKPPSHIT